jgi:intein/homing endonuclease
MEKIVWNDRVRNEVVLHRIKEGRNILHEIKRRKADWIARILCRNCLLKHVIEGKI